MGPLCHYLKFDFAKKIFFIKESGLLALNSDIFYEKILTYNLDYIIESYQLDGVKTCKINSENESELEKTLSIKRPDIIINAAVMTNIEECESKLAEAFKKNSIIQGVLEKIINLNKNAFRK